MASVISLGIHKPSALQYLVAESMIPQDPTHGQYEWHTSDGSDSREALSEEIITTQHCVVWSRGGIIQRVFRFDVEKEAVVQAVLTWFPTENAYDVSVKSEGPAGQPAVDENVSSKGLNASYQATKQATPLAAQSRASSSPSDIREGKNSDETISDSTLQNTRSTRALVVVLKTQAHIYLLSGTSHVLHLPFEVDSVLPTPRGLLLQRKLTQQPPATPAPHRYVVPPNSFLSSQTQQWASQSSNPVLEPAALGIPPLPSLHIDSSPVVMPSPPNPASTPEIPRLFSLTDPMSELGLVTATPFVDSTPVIGRDGKPTVKLGSLNHAEEIVYVSKDNGSPSDNSSSETTPPLLLAVTSNTQTGMYTVWDMVYLESHAASKSRKQWIPGKVNAASRRRTSHSFTGTNTGATTPIGRGPINTRESFGARARNYNVLGTSNANISLTSAGEEANNDATNELAAQLDPEFENPGEPAKASRRVSSLLARADLSTGHDRVVFSDLVTGNPGAAGMHTTSSRRGESFGGYSSRSSFGHTLGASRRGSVPPNSFHIHSNDTLRDTSGDSIMDELNGDSDLDELEELTYRGVAGGLRKEVSLTQLGSFATREHDVPTYITSPCNGCEAKVFTIAPPRSPDLEEHCQASTFVCIVNKTVRELLVLKIEIQCSEPGESRKKTPKKATRSSGFRPRRVKNVVEIRRAKGVIDACRLTQGRIQRMLILSDSNDGQAEITLQAPWSTLVRIELPSKLAIYHPFQLGPAVSPSRRRESGLKRVLSQEPEPLTGLQHEAYGAQVDIVDGEGTGHRIQVQLEPHDPQVARILELCQFVLPSVEHGGDGVLVGWWVVSKWLRSTVQSAIDHEWTALVVLLFTLAVGFIDDGQTDNPVQQKKRKANLLRSSSGANVDLESWNSMLDHEGGPSSVLPQWSKSAAWRWTAGQGGQAITSEHGTGTAPHPNRSFSVTGPSTISITRKNPFILRCASWARRFLKSAPGLVVSGETGYLPSAESRSPEVRRTALATILIGLHLLEEETKLEAACTRSSGVNRLTPVLAQLGRWLNWGSWSWKEGAYYSVEDADMENWLFEDSTINKLVVPPEPFAPPSVLGFVAARLRSESSPTFLSLLDLVQSGRSSGVVSRASSERAVYSSMKDLTPRTVMVTKLLSAMLDLDKTPKQRVEDMVRCQVDALLLETLPEGLAASLWEAIVHCQENPSITWGAKALNLVGRDDLSMLLSTAKIRNESSFSRITLSHDATRDVHNISTFTLETDTISAFDGSAEADRHSITRLIFDEDRRFIEAARLLHPMKPAIARCDTEPDWSEADLLEAQKELVQTVAIRTLAVPPGRGLLYYSARVPLLTERFPIHGFALSCVMKPSNNTVTADRNAFTEEKVCWAFFHAGVSAGLSISREAKGIDTSWIQFNKPAELNNRHAGFLLALGLNGHLKSIAKWVAFKYLTPKHTMTSIGLLLGLSASYLGTMDTLVTRLLSVHVTRMLPPGAAELNLSPLTQTTGIMGIGLLYCGTQHRRMSEVMLSEIEHIDQEDPSTPLETLRDEGYRLAAGFALGYINLGKGKDLKGLHDMAIVERLLSVAIGTKKVNIVHILDKATAGATIAIALIFMKSHNEALARKIDIPDTVHQFGYVRPDIFLLRTLARHLIMWSDIRPTSAWMQSVLPPVYRAKASMTSIRTLNSEDMPFYNIIAGICFSIGLRYAGSGLLDVRNLIGHYLDQFIRICNLTALNYDGKLTRTTVRNCQDLVALSAAAVMAGTGDLHIFRRLRALHGRVNADTPYGSHLAAHTAIGVLFLGGGNFTFGTSNIAVASLVCAFYPLFPTSVLDNKSHLQAFRHFWVLAVEARCLVARDVDTHRPLSIPITITLRNGDQRAMTAPGLLPDLNDIATVQTNSMAYWQITLDFANNPSHLSTFWRNQSVYVRKRSAHHAHSSVFSATLQALNDSENPHGQRRLTDFIFDLPVFAGFNKAEQALANPLDSASAAHAGTKGTMVDDRLVLEGACLDSGNRDRLLNLKLLFDWAEGERKKDGRLKWLGIDVVEHLRAAVWMASSDDT